MLWEVKNVAKVLETDLHENILKPDVKVGQFRFRCKFLGKDVNKLLRERFYISLK